MLIEERLLFEPHATDVALVGLLVLEIVLAHFAPLAGPETALIALVLVEIVFLCVGRREQKRFQLASRSPRSGGRTRRFLSFIGIVFLFRRRGITEIIQ